MLSLLVAHRSKVGRVLVDVYHPWDRDVLPGGLKKAPRC
jgi:hypothetical protein